MFCRSSAEVREKGKRVVAERTVAGMCSHTDQAVRWLLEVEREEKYS